MIEFFGGRRKAAIGASPFFCVLLAACVTPAHQRPKAMTSFSVSGMNITKSGPMPSSVDLIWKRQPTLAEIERLLPADRPGNVQFGLKCELKINGRLDPCEVQDSDPPGEAYERIAKRVAGMFVARTDGIAGGFENVWFVILSIRLSDGSLGAKCRPPFCVIVPPPPPTKRCPDGSWILARDECPPAEAPPKP